MVVTILLPLTLPRTSTQYLTRTLIYLMNKRALMLLFRVNVCNPFFLADVVSTVHCRPRPALQNAPENSQDRTYAAAGCAALWRCCPFVLESWNGMLPK